MRKFPLSETEFKEIYSKVPKVSAEVLVVVNDGVVMAKREHYSWKGKWYLPGATVHYRESLVDTCKRIGEEELRMSLSVIKFLDYVEFFSEQQERGFGYSIAMDFLCASRDEVPAKSLEGEELRVFKAVPDDCVAEHAGMLRRYFGGEFD